MRWILKADGWLPQSIRCVVLVTVEIQKENMRWFAHARALPCSECLKFLRWHSDQTLLLYLLAQFPSGKFSEYDDDIEVIDALFREIDTNRDGSISPKELQAALDRYQGHAKMAGLLRSIASLSPVREGPAQPGVIGKEQFRRAFEMLPRVRGERVLWARGLGLEGELARLLRPGEVFDGLKGLKDMDEAEREAHIREVCRRFGEALPALLRRGLEKLQPAEAGEEAGQGRAGDAVQEHINSKFVLDGAFVGRFATLDDFFAGPEQLIGTPNPKIEEGMETEHCRRGNCEKIFTTSNYNLTTWPKLEWEFVVAPKEGVRYPHTPHDKSQWLSWRGPLGCRSRVIRSECPPEEAKWKGQCGRNAESLDVHMMKPEVRRAKLIMAEVIGLRLYTGPLFVLYNAVLRGFPDKDVALLLDKEGRKNQYETTIYVIVSGITKIMGITEERKVFRGLWGMALPKQFWELFPECQITFEVVVTDTVAVNAVAKSIQDKVSDAIAAAAGQPEGRWVPATRTATATGTAATEISSEYLEVGQASWLLPAMCTTCLALLPSSGEEGLAVEQLLLERKLQEMAFKGARVVREAKAEDRCVRMSVALPVTKHAFVERQRKAFELAVRNLCGVCDVAVTDVADKPPIYRGIGERQRGATETRSSFCSRKQVS